MTKEKAPEGKRTYLIEFENGKKKKITVPDTWKVTFGPAVVGGGENRTGSQRYKMPMAIRFYESDKQQRAIFTNVLNFRDMSIDVQEERVITQMKDGFMEVDGSRKKMAVKTEVKEWVDPDDEDTPSPAKLIQDSRVSDIQDVEFEELD